MAENEINVKLTQAVGASQGIALVSQAQGIVIRNKEQHAACREFIKGAKALKKTIEDHYAAIKSPLNAARNTVLAMEKADLAPVLQAIEVADRIDTTYTREQQRKEAEEAEKERQRLEAIEMKRRQKEADKAEAEALKLEESSDLLSPRELSVVTNIVRLLSGPAHHASPSEWLTACRIAGYKDPEAAAKKLIRSEKIDHAVAAQLQAATLRQQAAAKKAEPITVTIAEQPSQVVEGGVRTYYACASSIDLITLMDAIIHQEVPMDAIQPNFTFLNQQARSLKELFPKAFPGCELVKRDGTVTA